MPLALARGARLSKATLAAGRHGRDVTVLPAGRWWDAVRASEGVGEHALRLLGAESGAVIQDRHGPLYWLVRTGAAEGWDVRDVRVLGGAAGVASYLGVPPAHRTARPGTHWRIPIGPGRYLTDAALLRGALALAADAECVQGEVARR